MNRGVLGELVTFESLTGFHLDGILYKSNANLATILHIHGSFGNFYQNKFIRQMAGFYMNAGFNLLSFNLQGHDGLAEGYRYESTFEYTGGALALFEECVSDIGGAVAFAKSFSNKIILQAHSLGCERVLHFLLKSGSGYDFVLLSPCDSYQLQTNWIEPETIEQQIIRLKSQDPFDTRFDWLPSKEYGIRQGDWVYPIPITRNALLSIMEGPAFQLTCLSQSTNFWISHRAIIYIGGKDDIQVHPSDDMFQFFEKRISNVTRLYLPDGDHSFSGYEQKIAEQVIQWMST